MSAGTVVAATSFIRLVAVLPNSDAYVEAPGLDIIMRRMATWERTKTPAMTSTRSHWTRSVKGGLVQHRLAKRARKKLDNKPQLKGRMSA
jgi:hypothetical protein